MSAEYSFDVDPSRDYLRVQMSGFFSPPDLPAFMEARQAAHARLTCPVNTHVTLIDGRGLKIQAQEMLEAFGRMLAASDFHARRLAVVVMPGLLRTQLNRAVAGRPDVRNFESIRMAEAWLFTPVFAAPIQNLVGQQSLQIDA